MVAKDVEVDLEVVEWAAPEWESDGEDCDTEKLGGIRGAGSEECDLESDGKRDWAEVEPSRRPKTSVTPFQIFFEFSFDDARFSFAFLLRDSRFPSLLSFSRT